MLWINNPQFEEEGPISVSVSADFVVMSNGVALMGSFQADEPAALDTLAPLPEGIRFVGGDPKGQILPEDLLKMKNPAVRRFLLVQLALEAGETGSVK